MAIKMLIMVMYFNIKRSNTQEAHNHPFMFYGHKMISTF